MPRAHPPHFEPDSRADQIANAALEGMPEDEVKRAVVLVVLKDNGASTAAHFEEEQETEGEAAAELLATLLEHAHEVASSIGLRLDLISLDAPGGLHGPDQN
jgi:hypothetical protein